MSVDVNLMVGNNGNKSGTILSTQDKNGTMIRVSVSVKK